MNAVVITYSADDVDIGWATIEVQCEGFGGRGSSWFNMKELYGFCEALAAYPLTQDACPILKSPELASCETLSIKLSPFGWRGQIQVRVIISSVGSHSNANALERQLTASFLVCYSDIDRFRRSLAAVLQRGEGDARLDASPT